MINLDTMTKKDLTDILKNNICQVIFEKVDGTERNMKCTLISEYLPEIKLDHDKPKKPDNPDVIAVWDIENKGWRSFRLDSIKSFDMFESQIN